MQCTVHPKVAEIVKDKKKSQKDNKIDLHRLSYVMRSIGQNPTDNEVDELFKKYKTGDNEIDLDGATKCGNDFADKMNAGGTDHKKALLEAFTVFDQKDQGTGKNTGNVSSGEIKHIISNLIIDNLEEVEVEELIAEVDPDGKGVIDYKEFVEVIFKPIDKMMQEA